jgi:LPPG:FO 2-phospho-L-lactate transferase
MSGHVLALCGGVGGAKLAFGLARILPPSDLTIVVNTGDDFVHLGLKISPDIDTVTYTLAGLSDRERGWGLAGESWRFLAQLRRLGGEVWYNLGDQDLALHVERTRRLAQGQSLSTITSDIAAALGVLHLVAPMTDTPVSTILQTSAGELAFQTYFVAQRCRPVVTGIRFEGAERARASAAFAAALRRSDLRAVVVCPSNPYLSIDPILALPGVKSSLASLAAPVVVVSPIIGGRAMKGPTVKLMNELGVAPDLAAIVEHYEAFATGFIVDRVDLAEAETLRARGARVTEADALMNSDDERERLARDTLAFADRLAARGA